MVNSRHVIDEYHKKIDIKITDESNRNKENHPQQNSFHSLAQQMDHVLYLKSKPRFVVQKHDATTLHYDFRLESPKNNVLLSWAVPKGPSLNPFVKRLAIPTEDHSVSYLTFEGVIPKGNYGAGSVIVWDIGIYSLKTISDIHRSIETKSDGNSTTSEDVYDLLKKYEKISFVLYGQKLKGEFSLVKIHNKNHWLLIKIKDEFAVIDSVNSKHSSNKEITETRPESVLSGKTNNEMI